MHKLLEGFTLLLASLLIMGGDSIIDLAYNFFSNLF
ncbi:hypothetical protein VPy01_17 [Vibrio phage VPy01]|uniref:Uncharacterized protein n=1 Tax=Vibrio phage vB_VpaS_HCMJ TaxID=2601627 RepID=A0A5C2ID44_9CAUD|nr:hypothetical protein HCMJ_85 [Vibrio phage vB_VpaS_HCMJ]UZM04586.1 hypothetical protein [Vibrio phage 27Ua.3]UZM04642.1 hypothetical protein [Vibrio phage 31Fb.4]WAG58468.1 hypothetical protein [Vibrio phage 33Fb.4]WJZ44403.1 hypothetical protein VPy01_17 [Vibrio phage VPy01]